MSTSGLDAFDEETRKWLGIAPLTTRRQYGAGDRGKVRALTVHMAAQEYLDRRDGPEPVPLATIAARHGLTYGQVDSALTRIRRWRKAQRQAPNL